MGHALRDLCGKGPTFSHLPPVEGVEIPDGPARVMLGAHGAIPPSAKDIRAASYRLVTMHVLNAIFDAHDWASGTNGLYETVGDRIDEFDGMGLADRHEHWVAREAAGMASRVEALWRAIATRHRIPFEDSDGDYQREIQAVERYLATLLALPSRVSSKMAGV